MQVNLTAVNMDELALRVAAAVNLLGFTKDGNPMVASQGLRVLANLAGYRQEHTLVKALKKEGKNGTPVKEPKIALTGTVSGKLLFTNQVALLQFLGFQIVYSDFKQPYWEWQDDEAGNDCSSEREAWLDAWEHLGEKLREKLSISLDTWVELSFEAIAQKACKAFPPARETLAAAWAAAEASSPVTQSPMEAAMAALESRWGSEHGWYGREEWREDVAQGNTKLGYWEWVQHSLEGNGGEEEHCDTCGKPLDEEGYDGKCGDCADVDDSLEELAEELNVSLDDAKFWVKTHYGVSLEEEAPVRREQLLNAYHRLCGLTPTDAPAVAHTKGHTNDDSVTTLETVTINGEDYALRVCGAGFSAYFEWINAGGDPIGDVHDELADAKAFALELAKRPVHPANDHFECASCHVTGDLKDSIKQDGELRCLTCANRTSANAVFEAYNFGDRFIVADHEGWEWTSGDSVMTKAVFLEDRENLDAPTVLVRFILNVENGVVTDLNLVGMPE